ncbi:Protein CBG09262 [Caenorhabditis briggsae]|uniref:Protein CBG09262 n=1 Tax=Caenorhabditis briggsae TaxID=6238 RepID=A8X9I1_CAEBR|nr:Protein CBG09262 [Caenorhabditis briggsae]CAP29293.1 Protein CBG09262 [Caenorhabditis briggsae]
MATESSVSSYTLSTDDSGTRQRKEVDELPQIGYTLEQLNEKREEPKWRIARFTAIGLFWAIWGALLAGSILIIILNNHDVASTTAAPTTTTKGK